MARSRTVRLAGPTLPEVRNMESGRSSFSPHPQSGAHTRELIASHNQGDTAALPELVRRYYDRVVRLVRVRMGPFLLAREAIEDVVQDVFVRVIQGVERFEARSDARFIDWLARLVHNELSNHSRREHTKKRGGNLTPLPIPNGESASQFDVPADTLGVATGAEIREQCERLDACVRKLPENWREVILLRRYAGHDWHTVGEVMGRSPEAAQELFRRAMVALTRLFESSCQGNERRAPEDSSHP